MCPVFCDTCYNETTCKICKSGPNRLGLPDNCQCEPGYFENNGVCSSNLIKTIEFNKEPIFSSF